ncbi:MAG: 50S ribosomal protein L18 [Deinococcota bacterium]|jgi:large subunit ribosomal protein L18|nr:50S ribosomal protein L18 [Deinococcota bacterium]
MRTHTTEERRRLRTRGKLKRQVETDRLRLTVFRSSKHIYAQIIDPKRGHTVAEANSKSLGLGGSKVARAAAVGKTLAERAGQENVKRVYFDRGAYRYHGRVKALAEGAREGGLEF